MESEKEAFVYMVMCEDGSLYTGITKDLRKRMKDHYFKTGKGAKYTKSRRVQKIMMVWEAETYASAARLEYAVKHLPRAKKLQLVEEPEEKKNQLFPKLMEERYIPRRELVMDVLEFLKTGAGESAENGREEPTKSR